MEHNDILIDPNAAAPMPLAPDRTVTIPHDPFDFGALVLPGLLGALCGHGVAALALSTSPPPPTRSPSSLPATRCCPS